jgi:hypothetical protein
MQPLTSRYGKLSFSLLRTAMLTLGLLGFTSAFAQNCFVNSRIKKITANVSPTIKSYLEFKPVDWATAPTKKYALLVYLGGTGEMFQQPGGSDQDLCPVLQYSMPWRMNVGHFPDKVTDNDGKEYSYLVVMPFVTKWEEQYQVDPGAMIDYAIANYPNRIDLDRIYLTGMSRGTDNIMGWATASATNSGRIAAMAPVANCFPDFTGSGNLTLFNQQVTNMANGGLHLYGISCANDKICTEKYMMNWVDSLNKKKPGFGLFTYSQLSCEGPDNSNHYAWNDAYNPDYRKAPGNKNLYEWLIQWTRGGGGSPPPPPPPTGTPNCSTVSVVPMAGALKVKGLIAPVATVQVFNSSWATVFNQTYTNYPDSITVPSLANGVYRVKVSFYTASWSPVCNVTIEATVGTTAPPPPPPPPPPAGTPDCSKITMTPLNKAIKIKGLIAPVAAVHVFNNNWTTAFNQTYNNSPDSITVSNLSAQTYHVKVTFYTSGWSTICEKMQDVAVTATGDAAPMTVAVETLERPNEITGRSIAVAPNPFVNSLMLTIGSTKGENANLSIMDLSGRQVYSRSVTLVPGLNRFSLTDIKNLRSGSYFLRVISSEGVQTIRVLRQ